MDLTTVSLYTNPFFTQNFFGLQNQNFTHFLGALGNDYYRHEDGSGDARCSLLVEERMETQICVTHSFAQSNAMVASSGSQLALLPAHSSSQLMSSDSKHVLSPAQLVCKPRVSPWTGNYHSRMPRVPASIKVGQEPFVIQADTVFVLGMRFNVTKKDIIMFFGRVGRIKMDEETSKPKIFVYKNKLTGRSKGEATITFASPYSALAAISCLSGSRFQGQVVTVLQAYVSIKQSTGVRYSYLREPGVDQQRRQRYRKWRPASDNWVCELCTNSNFTWRLSCNRCQASKNDASLSAKSKRRWRPLKSDWHCEYCYNANFWYREKCNRCLASKAEQNCSATVAESQPEPDKWELIVSQETGN